MAKGRTKPALTLDEHRGLGATLVVLRGQLDAIADDLRERYPARLAEVAARCGDAIGTLAGALDDVLWREQRGQVDRATLAPVYFPAPAQFPDTLASIPPVDPAVKAEPPPAPAVPKAP